MALVLVVEPESRYVERIEEALTSEGWEVRTVSDHSAALQAAADSAPSLVLVDGELAETDSLLAAFARRTGGPGAVVLVPEDQTHVEAADYGADDLVRKPFSARDLRLVVRRCLAACERRAPEEAELSSPPDRRLTSADLFGDMLAELEEEKPPPAASEPAPDLDSPAEREAGPEPGAAESYPTAPDQREVEADVERLLRERLGDVLPGRVSGSGAGRSPVVEPPPTDRSVVSGEPGTGEAGGPRPKTDEDPATGVSEVEIGPEVEDVGDGSADADLLEAVPVAAGEPEIMLVQEESKPAPDRDPASTEALPWLAPGSTGAGVKPGPAPPEGVDASTQGDAELEDFEVLKPMATRDAASPETADEQAESPFEPALLPVEELVVEEPIERGGRGLLLAGIAGGLVLLVLVALLIGRGFGRSEPEARPQAVDGPPARLGAAPAAVPAAGGEDTATASEEATAEALEPTSVRQGDIVEPGPGVVPPHLVSFEKPEYPPVARRLGVQGTVVLSLLVDEDGRVARMKLLKPVAEDAGLNQAAIDAARSARFEPATKDGVRVKMWYQLAIPFKL